MIDMTNPAAKSWIEALRATSEDFPSQFLTGGLGNNVSVQPLWRIVPDDHEAFIRVVSRFGGNVEVVGDHWIAWSRTPGNHYLDVAVETGRNTAGVVTIGRSHRREDLLNPTGTGDRYRYPGLVMFTGQPTAVPGTTGKGWYWNAYGKGNTNGEFLDRMRTLEVRS